MRKKIIVLQGLPGSGKSTWAKEWVKEDPKHRIRFNRDDMRNMMGPYWVPQRESLITELFESFLMIAMSSQKDIVIDNMNLNPKALAEIEELMLLWNHLNRTSSPVLDDYEIEIKDFFDVPVETCIERDSKRENPIGEEIIRKTYNKYKDSYPL